MKNQLIEAIEAEQTKGNIPCFSTGDTIKIKRVIGKSKDGSDRTQMIEGLVISRTNVGHISETVHILRSVHKNSMVMMFPMNSNNVKEITVTRRGRARRSKLYNLVGKTGKALKLKEDIVLRGETKKLVARELEAKAKAQKEAASAKAAAANSKESPKEES